MFIRRAKGGSPSYDGSGTKPTDFQTGVMKQRRESANNKPQQIAKTREADCGRITTFHDHDKDGQFGVSVLLIEKRTLLHNYTLAWVFIPSVRLGNTDIFERKEK
jgi:hypothetical protein